MSAPSRSAFTLLETLLALAIAATVVALVYSVFHTVQSTLDLQQARVAGPERAAAALQALADDLERAYVAPSDASTRFRMEPDPSTPRRMAFRFATLRADPAERDLRWVKLVEVTYALAEEERGLALLQTERPLTGPGSLDPPKTNRLASGLSGLAAEAHDGTTWIENWPPEEEGAADRLPRAVRIHLLESGQDRQPLQLEVLLGTGTEVPSRRERAGAQEEL